MDSRRYSEAAEHFSTVLLLNPVDRVDIFIKRSKARVLMDLCGDSLSDADEVLSILTLDRTVFVYRVRRPSSSTRHLTEGTSRGMQHYMVQDDTLRPLRHSIQCLRNWTSLLTNIFAVSYILNVTQVTTC